MMENVEPHDLTTLEHVRDILGGSGAGVFSSENKDARYRWIQQTLLQGLMECSLQKVGADSR